MFQRINTQYKHTQFNKKPCTSIRRLKRSASKQKGMTFIEVLIALVIMVTGILGAVAMQATAKKGSFDAMQRSLASSLAQDIVERMRGNNATTLANYAGTNYGTGAYSGNEVASCSSIAGCSAANMLLNDQYEWELALMGADVKNGVNNAGGLVNTRACIDISGAGNNQVKVVITWEGRTKIVDGNTENCGASNSKRRQVLVEAFII